ncbi:uncharacterized protein MYCFIDRAFT_208388 [Pseudocercospora fijiensis CIRAD86]|uniref:Uncharacterized protein n=1 Tax=Pseudocercospora fijiensis (strain CIRAD86) TaxID=383855 RepID=M2ZLA7_PSEFD|nr:uncharacterized protein MYCFIDRAFT_208388 [Pseudocercospora fijiensis CIRAD86]EME79849.1 hypothetical protein MYCFIDRAFT_208388 [Pseudocercospora fijiensis CIRAD86]
MLVSASDTICSMDSGSLHGVLYLIKESASATPYRIRSLEDRELCAECDLCSSIRRDFATGSAGDGVPRIIPTHKDWPSANDTAALGCSLPSTDQPALAMVLTPPRERSSRAKKRKTCGDDRVPSIEDRTKRNATAKPLLEAEVKQEPDTGISAASDEIVVASANSNIPKLGIECCSPTARVQLSSAESITLRIAQNEIETKVYRLERDLDTARWEKVAASELHMAQIKDLSNTHNRCVAALRAFQHNETAYAFQLAQEVDRSKKAKADLAAELQATKITTKLKVEQLTAELDRSSRLRQHSDHLLQETWEENETLKSFFKAVLEANELQVRQLTINANQQSRLRQNLQHQLREVRREGETRKRAFQAERTANELKIRQLTAYVHKQSRLRQDLERQLAQARAQNGNIDNTRRIEDLQAEGGRGRNAREQAQRDYEVAKSEHAQMFIDFVKEQPDFAYSAIQISSLFHHTSTHPPNLKVFLITQITSDVPHNCFGASHQRTPDARTRAYRPIKLYCDAHLPNILLSQCAYTSVPPCSVISWPALSPCAESTWPELDVWLWTEMFMFGQQGSSLPTICIGLITILLNDGVPAHFTRLSSAHESSHSRTYVKPAQEEECRHVASCWLSSGLAILPFSWKTPLALAKVSSFCRTTSLRCSYGRTSMALRESYAKVEHVLENSS